MKKILISLTTILCLAGSLVVAQEAAKRENEIVEQEPIGNPAPTNYVYPDNSDKKQPEFQATRDKLKEMRLLQKDAKIRQIKLVSYDEYLKEVEQRGGSVVQNMEVHPRRQFFMVDIEVPELEMPNRKIGGDETRENVKLKNARVRQIYDAETGAIFGSEISGTK